MKRPTPIRSPYAQFAQLPPAQLAHLELDELVPEVASVAPPPRMSVL